MSKLAKATLFSIQPWSFIISSSLCRFQHDTPPMSSNRFPDGSIQTLLDILLLRISLEFPPLPAMSSNSVLYKDRSCISEPGAENLLFVFPRAVP